MYKRLYNLNLKIKNKLEHHFDDRSMRLDASLRQLKNNDERNKSHDFNKFKNIIEMLRYLDMTLGDFN